MFTRIVKAWTGVYTPFWRTGNLPIDLYFFVQKTRSRQPFGGRLSKSLIVKKCSFQRRYFSAPNNSTIQIVLIVLCENMPKFSYNKFALDSWTGELFTWLMNLATHYAKDNSASTLNRKIMLDLLWQ